MIDVRYSPDFEVQHASCAISVPFAEVESWLSANAAEIPLTTPVISYCYRGVLSGKSTDRAISAGFLNSQNGGGYNNAQTRIDLEEACKMQLSCEAAESNNMTDAQYAQLVQSVSNARSHGLGDGISTPVIGGIVLGCLAVVAIVFFARKNPMCKTSHHGDREDLGVVTANKVDTTLRGK
jgi:rhodanese-related sulfurtransferase